MATNRPFWQTGLLLLVLALTIFLGINQLSQYFSQTAEDAYILFRYAENFGSGHGIVSFPGGPTEEGASSLSLLLLLGLGQKLGWSVPLLSKSLGVLSLLGCASLLYIWGRHAVRNTSSFMGAGLFVLFAASASSFLPIEMSLWSSAGLETLPTAFIFLFLAFAIWKAGEEDGRSWIWAAVLLAFIGANTRPEGALYALATFPLILLLRWTRGVPLPKAFLSLLPPIGLLTLLESFVLLLKFIYFGSIWSNPTFVKLSVSSFLDPSSYLLSFLQERGPLFWVYFVIQLAGLLLALLPLLRRHLNELDRAFLLSWAFVLMQVFVVYYTGGDYMAFHRFLVPALPTLAAATIFFSLRLRPKLRHPSLIIFPLLLGGTGLQFSAPSLDYFSGIMSELHPPRSARAVKKLLQAKDQDRPYAISECGYIPYHAHGPFIDLMGLNNKIIARSYAYYGIKGAPEATRDWILAQLPRSIISYDYWMEKGKLRIGEGVAWFFGCYFQSPFFQKYYDYKRELPNKKNGELLFSYFKGNYKGTNDLSAENKNLRELLLHGFFIEPDKIWTSTQSRLLLRPSLGHRVLHIEGWIPDTKDYPHEQLKIRFFTEGFAIGSKLFGEEIVSKPGVFHVKTKLPTNQECERNFLLTLRSSKKAHPPGSNDERSLSWIFRRAWTSK